MNLCKRTLLFAIFPALLGCFTFIGYLIIPIEILSYPLLAVTVASALFLLYLFSEYIPSRDHLLTTNPRAIDIVAFFTIALTSIAGQLAPSGVVDWYYPVAILTAGIITYRIAINPVSVKVQLSQILLFALALRATIWFSYPAYGRDRFHQSSVGYIVSTGEIIPESVTYYANFPHAHVFTAATTLITGLPLKQGYFALGVIEVASLVGVFLLGQYILQNEQGGLFAALIVSVAAYHIISGGEPFAHTLLIAFIPIVFYLLFHQNLSRRLAGILVGMAAFAATVQNIAPLVIVGVSLLIGVSAWLFRYLSPYIPLREVRAQYSFKIRFTFIVGSIGVYYYVLADYLRFQTMRIVWIYQAFFSTSEGRDTGQAVVEDTGVSGPPNVELFGQELPGVLMWAAPVLVIAGVLILVAYFVLYEIVRGEQNPIPLQYICLGGLTYSAFAVVFVSGSGGARRALPMILVLLSPLVAWLLYRFVTDRQQIGKALTVTIVLFVATAGVLTPPAAKSQLGTDDFQPYADSPRVASIEFTSKHTTETLAGVYAGNTERVILRSKGVAHPNPSINGSVHKNNPDSIRYYERQAKNGTTVLYFDYFQLAYSIEEPLTNKIYTSGNSSVYT